MRASLSLRFHEKSFAHQSHRNFSKQFTRRKRCAVLVMTPAIHDQNFFDVPHFTRSVFRRHRRVSQHNRSSVVRNSYNIQQRKRLWRRRRQQRRQRQHHPYKHLTRNLSPPDRRFSRYNANWPAERPIKPDFGNAKRYRSQPLRSFVRPVDGQTDESTVWCSKRHCSKLKKSIRARKRRSPIEDQINWHSSTRTSKQKLTNPDPR